ncbi:MAG TPA: hypothetical protein VJA25_02810 [Dehalococcoidia bacterium]|nr:hypothetical protein [Dehalococcoidia bacterium]
MGSKPTMSLFWSILTIPPRLGVRVGTGAGTGVAVGTGTAVGVDTPVVVVATGVGWPEGVLVGVAAAGALVAVGTGVGSWEPAHPATIKRVTRVAQSKPVRSTFI